MRYYFLSLNNNDCVNKSRIKNVKLIQSVSNERLYENIEVLAYETGEFLDVHMYDVITHKEIFKEENKKGITYSSKIPVDEYSLKRVLTKYNNLTNEELIRYKKGLLEIERNSFINS